MSDWNPSLYLHFSAERSRPAVELLARVPLENVEYVADLGCGPGNSTALLQQRWPAARITGIDSSPAMIAEARSALPDCQRAVSTARERTDTAGISASVYCCPAYGVNITSAGNDDREEFLLEFRLHRSSVTGQFQ